jgi:hypothetical protein
MLQVKNYNWQTQTMYDISDLFADGSIYNDMGGQPGKATLNIIKNDLVPFAEGNTIEIYDNEKGIFKGFIFTISYTKNNIIQIIAYDQTRYLKNQDHYQFKAGITSSNIFEEICKDYKLKYNTVTTSTFGLPSKIHDNKCLGDIIQESLDLTLIHAGKKYIIRDNFGTLEHIDLLALQTNYLIDDDIIIDYNYSSSIDNDVYNVVKLRKSKITKGDKKNGVLLSESNTIKGWGKLQYFETVDDNMAIPQMENMAKIILKDKNRPKRELSLSTIGNFNINAGNSCFTNINSVADLKTTKRVLITSVQHNIGKIHTMDLNFLEVKF